MRKVFLVCLALTLMVTLVVTGCAKPAPAPTPAPAPAPAPAKPIKLIFATWVPPGTTTQVFYDDLPKELEDKTGGRVTMEIAFGSVMGKPPEHYDLAVSGIADIAFAGFPYTPGVFLMTEPFQLPITGQPSCEALSKAFWQLYQKGYLDDDFKEVEVLTLYAFGPYHYHMAKGGGDILTFDDMKGKKIRASGAIHTEIVKAFGSAPVGMPAPDIYSAMEKGVIDGQFQAWDFIPSFRTEPVTASVTEVGVGGTPFGLVMNKDSHAKLPADVRAILDDISPKYGAIVGKTHDDWTERGKEMLKGAGGVINHLSAADMEKIGEAVAPLWEKWIADMEAKGLPARNMVDDLYRILKDMGAEEPFHGYAP